MASSAGDETVLEVRGLCKNFVNREGFFGKRVLRAVNNVSFSLARGKTVGLVGESGSGKSTVGLTIMRLHQADGGEVVFRGKNLLACRSRRRWNTSATSRSFSRTPTPRSIRASSSATSLPSRCDCIASATTIPSAKRWLPALLDRVGLPAVSLRKYPHEFSGGQRQRIAIARALTLKPEVLICDESVSALDVSVQAQVLNLLQDLQDEFNMSYLFISHDLAVVKYLSDQVIVMNAGEVVEVGLARRDLSSSQTGLHPAVACFHPARTGRADVRRIESQPWEHGMPRMGYGSCVEPRAADCVRYAFAERRPAPRSIKTPHMLWLP